MHMKASILNQFIPSNLGPQPQPSGFRGTGVASSLLVSLGLLAGWATAPDASAFDVARYEIFKGQRFVQTSGTVGPALASGNAFVFRALVQPLIVGWVSSASVKTPAGATKTLTARADDNLVFDDGAASAGLLAAAYGTGNYTVAYTGQIDGSSSVILPLGTDSYPGAPRVGNYDAAQAIDAANNFTLTWSGFAGGTAADVVRLQITDDQQQVIFDSGEPGNSEALAGNTTSVSIPADTMENGRTYSGTLTFYRLTLKDDTTYAPATASGGFYSETSFSLKPGGGGTSGGDTTHLL